MKNQTEQIMKIPQLNIEIKNFAWKIGETFVTLHSAFFPPTFTFFT